MKKKQYSSSEVESLLRDLVRHDRCQMDETMSERIVAHICGVTKKYKRRQRYKRLAVLAAPLLLLGLSIPLVGRAFTSGTDERPVAATPHEQPISEGAGPTEVTVATKGHRVVLSVFSSSLEAGFRPEPQQSYDGGDNQRYGASLYGACEYTACTDTF